MMHEDIIIASSEDKEYTIDLPHKDNILCIYNKEALFSILNC